MVVDLSTASVAKSTLVVLLVFSLLYLVYQISSILMLFFVAFLLAAAFDPYVDRMQKSNIPRSIGILIVYLILFGVLVFFVTNVVSLIADQVLAIAQSVGHFFSNLTNQPSTQYPFASQLKPYIEQFVNSVDVKTAVSQLQNAFQIVSTQLLSISFGLFNLMIVLVLTFFMVVEEDAIEKFFLSLAPSKYALYVSTRLEAVKDQIGHWLRGQLLVCFVSGFLTYVGFALMGVQYALTLSIIAGIGMIVPVIGGIFAWVIAFPIVFNQSPALSLWMTIYYAILQQFEANLLIPYVMNRVVGLSPIIIIFAMMVGGQFMGVLGLILSIPVATTITIFVKDYTSKQK